MKRFLLFLIVTVANCSCLRAQLTITGQPPSCNGVCNGAVQVIGQNGNQYHYLWNTGNTLAAITNLCSGTYQCLISDSQRVVFDTLNITLQQPSTLAITPLAIKNATCNGDSSGYVRFHATGGTGTRYNFVWSTGYAGFLSDSTRFNLPAGNYTITITDINGCSSSTGFAITQPQPIAISPQVTNTTFCSTCNGAIAVTASEGASTAFNFLWSTGATTSSISSLCPGSYNITAIDSSGCSKTAGVNVFSVQSTLSVSFSTATNIDCHHPTGFLFASPSGNNGAVHYKWNTGSTAPDIFNIPEGIYQVSVTDSSGCFAVATDTIQNLGLVITTLQQHDFRCDINQGQIIVTATQGNPPFNAHWSNGINSDTLNGLRPGNYTVTVTDQANCSASKTYNIQQQNDAISLTTTAISVSCKNRNNGSAYVNVHGALTPNSYLWNTIPVQTNDTATGLAIGNYNVLVTDSFGCSVSATVRVDSNYNQVSTTVTIGNCDSTGSATANISIGSPPYTYLWNTQPAQTNATANALSIGNYMISVTDSAGCIRTGAANIQYSCTGYITGSVFYDANANCHMDGSEHGVAGITVLATNSNITFSGLTNLTGQYSIPVTAAGTYSVITAVSSSSAVLQYGGGGCGYLEFCPTLDTVTFVNLNDTFPNHNFGFVGTSDFDLAIQVGWSPANASHQKEYWILYANQAFLAPYTDSATIIFNYDPNLTFQSGIPAPVNNASLHTLTWVVDSLPSPTYLWADRVRAFFTVSTGIPSNYQLHNSFHIQPYTGDCDTANNSFYTDDIAGLPVTPVSKEVSPSGDITVNDSVLTYTIHFQNTGADTARVIKVIDTLSPYLEPHSIVNVASNPLFDQFYMAQGAVLTWVFNRAMLPDSAVDPIGSAGFVSFKATLKSGTHPGNTVQNKASVYFNNGPEIATNTTANYISFPVAVVDLTDNPVTVEVFPNPFNTSTTVLIQGINDKCDFELRDITGRVVKSLTSVPNRFQLDRGELTAGVYIYCIYGNHKPLAMGRLVIE